MTIRHTAQSIDLNGVAAFVKVVEAGSFSGAARLLTIPKTTLSTRVAALEAALGVTLIHRTTRKMHVTEPGQRYFQHCAKAIRELDAGSAVVSADEQPQGRFRITAPVDIGHVVLPPIVARFAEKNPRVQVELLLTNRLVDLVGEGVDLAIRAGARKSSTLVGKRFFELKAGVWTTPAYLAKAGRPKTPKALAKLNFIGFRGMSSVRLSMGKATAKVPIAPRITCDDFEGVKALVMLGGGVAWLPDFLVAKEAAAGHLVPALPGWAARADHDVFFTFPSHRRASANVRAFIDTALTMQAG